MAGIKDVIDSVGGWLKSLIDLGLAFILILVIINILFPEGPIRIIDNIGAVVGSFAENGVVGLIALLLFMLVYKK